MSVDWEQSASFRLLFLLIILAGDYSLSQVIGFLSLVDFRVRRQLGIFFSFISGRRVLRKTKQNM